MKGDDDPGFRTLDVANMRGGLSGVTEQQRANARLIAAAPDLLAACERVLADGGIDVPHSDLADMLDAVIKKARGEK